MAPMIWTKKIPFLLKAKDCITDTNGFLSMTRSGSFYRAVLRVHGEADRTYGTHHEDAYRTAKDLLCRFPGRIAESESNRVLDVVEEVYGCLLRGSQPRKEPVKPVAIVHQIYGLFRDGKSMPFLFQNSQLRWQEVARQMGAQYHLWSADEVDALLKEHFPQFWAMYKSVPFPVMRVDIARICILHHYGGMYIDLDVFPNCDSFAQVPLAVQKAYTSGYKTVKSKSRSKEKQHPVYYKVSSIDIEVLFANQCNPVLMRWLIFIRNQLAVRRYKKNLVWAKRRIRYIHSTTGPECFKRFLRTPTNKALLRTLKYIPSNNFSHSQGLTRMEQSNFDVLTFQSNSYFGDKKAFQTPVGDGEGPLPVLDGSQPSMLLCRRFRGKRKPLKQDVRSQCVLAKTSSEESSVPDVGAQGIGSQPSAEHPRSTAVSRNISKFSKGILQSATSSKAASSQDTPPPTSQGTHVEKLCSDQGPQMEKISTDQGTQTELSGTQMETISSEATQLSENVEALRKHVKRWANCQATKIFRQDLPAHLQAFLAP